MSEEQNRADGRADVEAVLASVFDEGSFASWDSEPPEQEDPDYRAALGRAAQRAGRDESVVTGAARLAGRRVAVVAGEFGFLAGSVGMAAADRVSSGLRRATLEGLPVVALPTSGGTRMQEGTPAFLRMVPVAAAVQRHRNAGLPYVVWLRDPTTGGVMATWGSLGQVTAAAPGALAGFLGPRVFEAMRGEEFPAGVQVAENLVRVGVIDALVPLSELRGWLTDVLDVLGAGAEAGGAVERAGAEPPESDPDGWDCVLATRAVGRPGAADLLSECAERVTYLAGTGEGERDAGMLIALARVAGTACVVAAQDRRVGSFGPAGLRAARRAYRLAAELRLPLLTIVDTEGAEVSATAEEGAMAGEIARSLAELGSLETPVVSLLLGSGCGGGALAMLPGDVVIAAADAWVTPLPPEGASAILYRTVDRAPELARGQQISAVGLARRGVVDVLVEAPGADPSAFLAAAANAAAAALRQASSTFAGRGEPDPRRVARFAVAPR
ncbi:MAG: carboxyl transferase domain-containing protein [Candidatus Nanopelagicales bacterium]